MQLTHLTNKTECATYMLAIVDAKLEVPQRGKTCISSKMRLCLFGAYQPYINRNNQLFSHILPCSDA